jgi:putative hydrolase of the HAD superfamily
MNEAILFDAAGTLLHVYPSVGGVYAQQAIPYGVAVEPKVLGNAFRDEWRRRQTLPGNASPFHTSEAEERAWWKALVAAVFDGLRMMPDFQGRFDAYFDALYDYFTWPEAWRLYDDVYPVLTRLETTGIRKAVVSNWDSRLPLLLSRMGLSEQFEFILTSAEVGWRKPDPRIFEEALRRLELAPERVAYVGDSYEDDVVGAGNAGLRAIHLDRKQTSTDAAAVIHSLDELPL